MFRYDQNVPNRHEVPPSSDWTSESPLLTTVVTVGTTCERVKRFWTAKKGFIVSASVILIIGSVCAGVLVPRHSAKNDAGPLESSVMLALPSEDLRQNHEVIMADMASGRNNAADSTTHKPKKHHRNRHHGTTTTTDKPSLGIEPVVAVIPRATEKPTAKTTAEVPASPKTSAKEDVKPTAAVVETTTTLAPRTNSTSAPVSPPPHISSDNTTTTPTTTTTTTSTTTAPPPKPCDRDPAHHKNAWKGITEKNPISVLNEMKEDPKYAFEKCQSDDEKMVFRCTVVLPCDGSRYAGKFAFKKQKAKELAARAACEDVYKIKFTKELHPDREHAYDCQSI